MLRTSCALVWIDAGLRWPLQQERTHARVSDGPWTGANFAVDGQI